MKIKLFLLWAAKVFGFKPKDFSEGILSEINIYKINRKDYKNFQFYFKNVFSRVLVFSIIAVFLTILILKY